MLEPRPPLPAARLAPVVSPLIGQVFFRPWWDALGVPIVTGMYLPLSRAWAAAATVEGDDVRPVARALGIAAAGAVFANRVRAVGQLARLYEQAEAAWQQAFFDRAASEADLAAVAKRRDHAAFRFMLARRDFLPWLRRLPAVHWDVAKHDEVWTRRGAVARGERPAYPAPNCPDVTMSGALSGAGNRQYWLRYPSPVLTDQAWAHVYEPARPRPRRP